MNVGHRWSMCWSYVAPSWRYTLASHWRIHAHIEPPTPLLTPSICMDFQACSVPICRISHPGADEREGQDHPRATGLPVTEEGGREAVFSLLQAFNHLHQRFRGEVASHQGVHSQLHITQANIALLCSTECIFPHFWHFWYLFIFFIFSS